METRACDKEEEAMHQLHKHLQLILWEEKERPSQLYLSSQPTTSASSWWHAKPRYQPALHTVVGKSCHGPV